MAFLIPDTLRSRPDIPLGIREVARAFANGLDDAVTVWYEPPFDATGRRPHLVVFAPDEGVTVLEVLDARDGGLLGAFRGRLRLERDGREIELEHPLQRAEAFANLLKQRIAAERRLDGVAVPVGAGAAFAGLPRAAAEDRRLDRVAPLERCLFHEELEAGMLGDGETAIRRAFARMRGGAPATMLDAAAARVVHGLIHPETVIDEVARSPAGQGQQLLVFRPPDDDAEVVRVMDRRQEQFARSIGEGHRVVRGVAGSGKTLLLVFRARLLSELHPGWRILVTCFSRPLAATLRQLLAPCENVQVRHLDGLLSDWIRDAGAEHPGYEDRARDRVLEAALEARAALPEAPAYHAVLVDEAQDFSADRLRAVTALVREGGDLLVVADPAQNIFRHDFSWRAAGIQAQGRTRVLRENYRNTRQVLDFAWRFLFPDGVPEAVDEDDGAIVPPTQAHRVGPEPAVEVVDDLDAEIEAVRRAVQGALEEHRGPRGVAVLYAAKRDGGRDRDKLLRARLAELASVFWMNDPAWKGAKDGAAHAADPVVLSTLYSAKGLEFPAVVLAGLSGHRGDTRERMAAYVGMTRATQRLHVVVQRRDALAPAAVRAAGAAQ